MSGIYWLASCLKSGDARSVHLRNAPEGRAGGLDVPY